MLLFTKFAEYQIKLNPLLRQQFNRNDFQEEITSYLVVFFQVARDCPNITRMDFDALYGGGGGGDTSSPGINQPGGQSSGGGRPSASSGGGQPPASSSLQELAAFVLERESVSEERHLQTLEKMVGASETRQLQTIEKMVGASETRQGQSFAKLMEALDQRQNQARTDSEKLLLQAQKDSAAMVLKHSKDYTDQRFNELQSQLDSYEKKLADQWNFQQEESEMLKASLMALEMEISKGDEEQHNIKKSFTLPTGQTGFYADGELQLSFEDAEARRQHTGRAIR